MIEKNSITSNTLRRRDFCKTICGVIASLSTTGILSKETIIKNNERSFNLYISPEAMKDICNWNVYQVDKITRI